MSGRPRGNADYSSCVPAGESAESCVREAYGWRRKSALSNQLNLHSRGQQLPLLSEEKSDWMVEITKGQRRINEHNTRCGMKEHSDTTMHYLLIHL